MTTRTQEQINQINTILIEFDPYKDIKEIKDKYQLEIYKAFYQDIKNIMGGI